MTDELKDDVKTLGKTAVQLVLEDVNLGEVLVTGAVGLILKLKAILGHHAPDVTADIRGLDADAQATYKADLDQVNAWLAAHRYPPIEMKQA